MCGYFACLHLCLCTIYMPDACGGQKEVSDPPGLELQMVFLAEFGFINSYVCVFFCLKSFRHSLLLTGWSLGSVHVMNSTSPWPSAFTTLNHRQARPHFTAVSLLQQLPKPSLMLSPQMLLTPYRKLESCKEIKQKLKRTMPGPQPRWNERESLRVGLGHLFSSPANCDLNYTKELTPPPHPTNGCQEFQRELQSCS